jgi:6-phosphogluconate dehydrogenase
LTNFFPFGCFFAGNAITFNGAAAPSRGRNWERNMTNLADIGVLGLSTMGANLARNAARKGFGVAVYNRHGERTDELISAHGKEGRFTPSKTIPEFVASLSRPRAMIIMVKAGKPVDDVIAELAPHLEEGDIIIDGGNSLFTDTSRRFHALAEKRLRFLGMGVSGGEEGALEGPSMMPGGDRDAYARIEPIVTKMAAQVDGAPCCAFIGPEGAGHYVKMVHNGIEYADMQLITEAYDLFKTVYGLDAPAIAAIFEEWNKGELDSYLIEITAAVLRKRDSTGGALVDAIVDEAEQKGTGRWTAQSALDLGVPLTSITEAVYARALSGRREHRIAAEKLFPHAAIAPRPPTKAEIDAIQDALYASKIVAYAQGFEQMTAASEQFKWDLKLGEVSSLWRGGCIIRARFLKRIREAYDAGDSVPNLLLQSYFHDAVVKAEPAWRRVVSLAVEQGVPVPAFSSSLAYYDGLRRSRGPANILQGLRDYFGAHTYRRLDKEGSFHTRWGQDGSEIKV